MKEQLSDLINQTNEIYFNLNANNQFGERKIMKTIDPRLWSRKAIIEKDNIVLEMFEYILREDYFWDFPEFKRGEVFEKKILIYSKVDNRLIWELKMNYNCTEINIRYRPEDIYDDINQVSNLYLCYENREKYSLFHFISKTKDINSNRNDTFSIIKRDDCKEELLVDHNTNNYTLLTEKDNEIVRLVATNRDYYNIASSDNDNLNDQKNIFEKFKTIATVEPHSDEEMHKREITLKYTENLITDLMKLLPKIELLEKEKSYCKK